MSSYPQQQNRRRMPLHLSLAVQGWRASPHRTQSGRASDNPQLDGSPYGRRTHATRRRNGTLLQKFSPNGRACTALVCTRMYSGQACRDSARRDGRGAANGELHVATLRRSCEPREAEQRGKRKESRGQKSAWTAAHPCPAVRRSFALSLTPVHPREAIEELHCHLAAVGLACIRMPTQLLCWVLDPPSALCCTMAGPDHTA